MRRGLAPYGTLADITISAAVEAAPAEDAEAAPPAEEAS